MIVQAVLQACLDWGIRDFCVCSGSRNGAFIEALLTHRHLGLRLHPFFEERSAAFFALGRIAVTGKPCAVLTTSGTAAAELLPATVEAHYQAKPLVLITADRPKRFRGSGAPQAIEQAHLFGPYARCLDLDVHDLHETAPDLGCMPSDRPLHLNVCLEEPSATPERVTLRASAPEPENTVTAGANAISVDSPARTDETRLETFLQRDEGPLLILAGCLEPDTALTAFLQSLEAPILAEATSGLHAETLLHPLLVRGGDRSLRDLQVTRVLRLGGVPSFRFWRDLENRPDIEVLSVTERPFSGLARPSDRVRPPRGNPPGWPVAPPQTAPPDWREVEARSAARLEDLLRAYPRSEPACIRELLGRVPEKAALFSGSSLPIRELGLVGSRQLPRRVLANRGANGIDGNLSSFFGMAGALTGTGDGQLDEPECWAILGDLTVLYDLAAPAILENLATPPLRVAVIHNGGGKIFRRLPSFRHLGEANLAVIENPHRFDFEAWARAWGLEHRHFPEQTVGALPGRVVIELRPDPEETERFWEAWQTA